MKQGYIIISSVFLLVVFAVAASAHGPAGEELDAWERLEIINPMKVVLYGAAIIAASVLCSLIF